MTRWNEATSYPIQSGHGCIGCSENNFWDNGPFYRHLASFPGFGIESTADRLAEAFAELMHKQVRDEWGLRDREGFTNEELIAEKYKGIRPAFGYPACPDHTEKGKLLDLLGAADAGIGLTESFAMTPAASVSGIYLAHPEARYFSVGRIDRDQVEDYARRKGMGTTDVEKWLAPNLAYDPGD